MLTTPILWLTAALAAQPTPAAAPADGGWRQIGFRGEAERVSLDDADVSREGDVTLARLRFDPDTEDSRYRYSLARFELRCAAGEIRPLQVIEHRHDDTIVTDDIQSPFRPIVAGSIGDLLRRHVCASAGAEPR